MATKRSFISELEMPFLAANTDRLPCGAIDVGADPDVEANLDDEANVKCCVVDAATA